MVRSSVLPPHSTDITPQFSRKLIFKQQSVVLLSLRRQTQLLTLISERLGEAPNPSSYGVELRAMSFQKARDSAVAFMIIIKIIYSISKLRCARHCSQ